MNRAHHINGMGEGRDFDFNFHTLVLLKFIIINVYCFAILKS